MKFLIKNIWIVLLSILIGVAFVSCMNKSKKIAVIQDLSETWLDIPVSLKDEPLPWRFQLYFKDKIVNNDIFIECELENKNTVNVEVTPPGKIDPINIKPNASNLIWRGTLSALSDERLYILPVIADKTESKTNFIIRIRSTKSIHFSADNGLNIFAWISDGM